MYFLIITFGLMLAMRGSRPARLEKPGEGGVRVLRGAADFFLTVSLTLALWTVLVACEATQTTAREYAILGFGIFNYLLSRYQKKTEVFFLAAATVSFVISVKQADLLNGLSLAWAVSAGMALFQTCFLGLRYKLLFSRVPPSIKGWPVLCLLAAFISLTLWSLGRLVF
jgi:Na+-translocating ferredoxin:NAD+ oxidoreductase RnfA subunit